MAYFHWHCITDHCPDMRWQVVTPWIAMVSSAQCLVSHWLEHDQGQELTGMTLVLTLATLHAIHWPLEAAGHHTTTHMISLQYRPADRVAMQPAGVVSPLVTLLRCCSAHGHYWHCSSLPERVARWPGQTAQQHSHSTVLPDNTTICGTHSGTGEIKGLNRCIFNGCPTCSSKDIIIIDHHTFWNCAHVVFRVLLRQTSRTIQMIKGNLLYGTCHDNPLGHGSIFPVCDDHPWLTSLCHATQIHVKKRLALATHNTFYQSSSCL